MKSLSFEASLKGNLRKLKEELEGLGFSSVSFEGGKLIVEKIEATDIKGNPTLFYKFVFYPEKINVFYSLSNQKLKRNIEILATILNMFKVCEKYYEINITPLFNLFLTTINEVKEIFDENLNLYDIKELKINYDALKEKYKELLSSNEENAKILLECEKKRDKYYNRIKELEGMSDERLRREVFRWIKTHNGEMDINEFIKHYKVSYARVEEVLNYLLKNKYIRKRSL